MTPEEAQELLDGATPGPWRWFGNVANRSIYLATIDRGRTYVMSFFRWGMQGATPAFRRDGFMENAETYARYEVAPDATEKSDPRLYRHDFQGLRHPDAELIAAAPDLARAYIEAAAQVQRVRELHRPVACADGLLCWTCRDHRGNFVQAPCPTVRLLDSAS